MNYGIMTALVTPVDSNGDFDKEELTRIVEDQISHGVHSLLALGGTGENMGVSPKTRRKVLETVVKTANHRVPIIAGVVELGIHDAIRNSKLSRACEVDALLVSTPFGANTSTKGCVDYYKIIYEAVKLPLLIYNFPGRTGYNTTPDVVSSLLENVEGIVGIKECAVRFDQTTEEIKRFGDKIQILSGNELLAPWEMLIGAKGAVLASSNLLPREWVNIYNLAQARKTEELTQQGMKYLRLLQLLFMEQHPGPLKYAMNRLGFKVGSPLVPNQEASKQVKEEIDKEMKKLNLL